MFHNMSQTPRAICEPPVHTRTKTQKESRTLCTNTSTHLVLSIDARPVLTKEPHEREVAAHSRHVQRRLPVLVGALERTSRPHQALHHTLVPMPHTTVKGRVTFLEKKEKKKKKEKKNDCITFLYMNNYTEHGHE